MRLVSGGDSEGGGSAAVAAVAACDACGSGVAASGVSSSLIDGGRGSYVGSGAACGGGCWG